MARKRKNSVVAENDAPAKRAKRVPKEVPEDLPSKTLTPEHNDWLDPYQQEYSCRVGKRGARNSAAAWVRSTLVGPFLDEFFPRLDADDRSRFLPFIAASINNRFNNRSHKINIADPTQRRGLTNPEFLWEWDNKNVVETSWRAEVKKDPGLHGKIGPWRRHVCELFKKLPVQLQVTYKQRFEDMKAKRKVDTIEDDDKLGYLNALVRKFDAMCHRAEEQGGIFFEGNIGVVSGGVLRLQRVSTKLGKQYLKSEEGVASVKLLEGWLGTNLGKVRTTGNPDKAVIPVREEHMRPQIPDMTGGQPTLQLGRSAQGLRVELYGGAGRLPYKEIAEAISQGDYSWIPEDCIPEGTKFDESGRLNLDQVLIWLRYLVDWELSDPKFMFSKVYTVDSGTLPTVNQASSRKPVTRNGANVCIAHYDAPITEPQNVRPIFYPGHSWEYFYFLQDGRTPTDPTLGLDHWTGLPCRAEPDVPCQGPIGAKQFDFVQKIFAKCNEDVRSAVTKSMNAINTMESRAPVWTENGLWEKGDDPFNNMPRVLPFYKPTNLSGLSYWQDLWLDIAYFQRPKPGMEQYRIDFWEGWQSDRRTSGPSYHAKSGTLVGGTEGIVWIIRGNLKILANAGALMLGSGVELPTPLLEGYDGRRLSVGDFERALDWVKEWTDVIHQSITVLDTTYQERWWPADFPSHDPRPSSLDNDDQDNNVPVTSGSGLRRASSNLGDDPWGDLDAGYEPNDHDSVGSLEPE
ncbi:hypothetical protein FRC10_004817, partial [Ceratobasidium sp. 414]